MKKKNLILLALGFCLISSVASASCAKRVKLNILKDVKVYQCEDQTITFSQPNNSTYEGLCGPTAGANAFYAYCKNTFVDPKLIAPKYFWDITPGVRPDVLTTGLNRMFKNNLECMKGKWKYYYVTNRWDFLNSLYYEVRRGNGTQKRIISNTGVKAIRSPVLVLTKASGQNLHWVTVVDIVGFKPGQINSDYEKPNCNVIYNDSGTQTTEACSTFIKRSHEIDDHWYTDIILPEYVHLVFEPA
jgi:hypothetical protein